MTMVSTKEMSRDQWLEARRESIGGSDAAAIVGLNKYATPYSVWMDKLGMAEEKPETEAMRIGRDLEDYVAKRFTEATGKKVRRRNAIIKNPDYPWAHANIDREIVGENAILECKTASKLSFRSFKNGKYPDNYYVQCMHYMAVTGAKKAYLAILVLQEGFHWFEINRDEDEIKALMTAEKEFWQHVIDRTEPPVMAGDSEDLMVMHPESNGQRVDLFGTAGKMEKYLSIKADIKELESEADAIATEIKQMIGDFESGQDGEYVATWRSQTRSTFDKKAFSAARPDIDLNQYMKIANSRVFTVKKIGEA